MSIIVTGWWLFWDTRHGRSLTLLPRYDDDAADDGQIITLLGDDHYKWGIIVSRGRVNMVTLDNYISMEAIYITQHAPLYEGQGQRRNGSAAGATISMR